MQSSWLSRQLPNQTQMKIMENKSAQKQDERPSMETLQSRLKEETDKITRWKVTTEVNLNQKERQLADSQNTNKVLRNNLIEQQLNSELLSDKLLREKNHREQLEEQVAKTRDMVNILQERHDALTTTVTGFTKIRETLEARCADSNDQLQYVSSNLNELTLKHHEVVEEITSKAELERRTLMQEKDGLALSLSEKEQEAENLKDESNFKDEVVERCGLKIFILEQRIETVSAERQLTILQLNKTKNEFEKVKTEFEQKLLAMESSLSKLQDVRAELEQRVIAGESSISRLEDVKAELEQKVVTMETSISQFENAKAELEQRVATMETSVSELQEVLKEERDKLSASRREFEEAVEQVKHLTGCNVALEGEKEQLQVELQAFRGIKDDLEKEISVTSKKYEELMKVSSENEIDLRKEKLDVEKELEACRMELKTCIQQNKDITATLEETTDSVKRLEAQSEEVKIDFEKKLHDKTEEILAAELNLKEVQSQLQSSKKSLNFELKKNEKLKTRVQTLETKFKDRDSKSKTELQSTNKLVEEIKAENEALQSLNEDLKEKMKESEASYRAEIQETKKLLNAAKKDTQASEQKALVAEREADARVKEMMKLSEVWKRDSEAIIDIKNQEISESKKQLEKTAESLQHHQENQKELLKTQKKLENTVQEQAEEILSLNEKLKQQVVKFEELQTAIKSLSEHSTKRKDNSGANLKTPSPSEYLKFCRPKNPAPRESLESPAGNNISSVSSTESSRAIDEGIKASRNNQATNEFQATTRHRSIMKPQPPFRTFLQGTKNVSFLSPVCHRPDSDSSDGYTLEIPSDTDDRFDTIKRSSQSQIRHRQAIPKANIQPMCRKPFAPAQPQQVVQPGPSNIRPQPPAKKPRYDKTNLKTYTSSKAKQNPDVENRPPARNNPTNTRQTLPTFDNIF